MLFLFLQGRSSGDYAGKGRSLASGEFPSQGRSSGEYHGHGRSSSEYPGRSLASGEFPCQGRPGGEFLGPETQLRLGEECQGFLESPGQGRASPPEPAPSHTTRRYHQPYTTGKLSAISRQNRTAKKKHNNETEQKNNKITINNDKNDITKQC